MQTVIVRAKNGQLVLEKIAEGESPLVLRESEEGAEV